MYFIAFFSCANDNALQMVSTATNLCAGNYTVFVADSLGVMDSVTVVITQPSSLLVSVNTTNISCNGMCDGSATINVTGGVFPYTYLWSNGNTAPTDGSLCAGVYSVNVTDNNGCISVDNIAISNTPPFSAFVTIIGEDTCGACTASATATPVGGTPPYTYSWNTAVVQNTPTVTGLCAGTYSCIIMDVPDCMVQINGVVNFAPGIGCQLGTVNGKVYNDINTNCTFDTLENGLNNIMLVANPGPYYASTDVNGNYSMVLPFDNYTITQVLPAYATEICPVSGSYSLVLDSINNTITNIDFADSLVPFQDVSILLNSGAARPGFYYTSYLNYTSLNPIPMNGVVSLVYDTSVLTYNSSSIAPSLISGDTLFWDYNNLQQFENRVISATFYIPADINLLGDTLQACAQITPLIGDVDVANNTSCQDRVIVGSYDPNDKQVFPQGDILLTDNTLKYTIQFQNSGTDTAFNVVVIDTLSSYLDVTSIRKVVSSHPFEYSISGQGILTFTFNNIILPDSNVNEPASHGLIQFEIDQNPSNIVGVVIENNAAIYFDFNPAIVTNTTINTVVLPTNIEEIKLSNAISVYPNPTDGKLKISFSTIEENEVNIALFDITGRKVNELTQSKKMSGTQVLDWNIGNVNSGIYFLSVKIGDKNYSNKIVVR